MSEPHPDFETLRGPDRRRLPKPTGLSGAVTAIAAGVIIGMILLWPDEQPDIDLTTFGFADDTVGARVVEVVPGPCSFDESFECVTNTVEITHPGWRDQGLLVQFEFPDEDGQPRFEQGDRVYLHVIDAGDGTLDYQYADRDRTALLLGLTAFFAVAVILLGRWRGVAALAGLGLSIGVLLGFILPAIVVGADAVLVAVVGGGAIALISLYLAHGYTPLTHVATLGAFAALLLTTALSWLVVSFAGFAGLVEDEAFYLLAIPDLDLNGLLLAGIVLGGIGALDDVTVTQASAVWEVKKANPALGQTDLFESGLRVGRDHIVSTVNTLLLAYAGVSLPLLILFTLAAQPFGVAVSSEVVAVEIVRTLVGSIGLVAAVPITTWLASRVAGRDWFNDEMAHFAGREKTRGPGRV